MPTIEQPDNQTMKRALEVAYLVAWRLVNRNSQSVIRP